MQMTSLWLGSYIFDFIFQVAARRREERKGFHPLLLRLWPVNGVVLRSNYELSVCRSGTFFLLKKKMLDRRKGKVCTCKSADGLKSRGGRG
jgi:hypothetical protein